MSACICSPAANAADAVNTICPPMETQPVNHEATRAWFLGAKTATQWYWPVHFIVSIGSAEWRHRRVRDGCLAGEWENSPPAVGQIEAISANEAAIAIVPRKEMILPRSQSVCPGILRYRLTIARDSLIVEQARRTTIRQGSSNYTRECLPCSH